MLLYKTGTCFVKTVPVTSIIILNQRFSQKTHYDVLGLTKNCTTKDVKSAFIKLSKTYHPDKNTGQVSHQKFVRILEAYSILSKPDKRQYYDWELVHGRSSANDNYSSSRQRPVRYSYPDQTIWENRDRSKDKYYREKPYYGIPGVQKFPNGTIALFCVLFACFGGLLQYFAIRHSFTLKRDLLSKQSQDNAIILAKLQQDVEQNGNDLQIQLMEKNF